MNKGGLVILILFLVLLSALVIGSAVWMLPAAPHSPTPTYPKGIEFPDLRPLPR